MVPVGRVAPLILFCMNSAAFAAENPAPPHPRAAAAASHAERGYAIGPVPEWVVPAKESEGTPVERAPMHYELIDEQVRLGGKLEQDYAHVVRVVNDSSGLSVAAHIEVVFDPTFQKVTLHRLDLVRDGQRTSRLNKDYPLLRRETQLERQMYDGRETLSINIDDVRTGDKIDYAYTVSGANPVFDGKFVHVFWMRSTSAPEALHQARLLAPVSRDIHVQAPADVKPQITTLGALRESIFRRENVPRFSAEPLTAYSALTKDQLWFSEFADWGEVARWGAGLFSAARSERQLAAQAEELKAGRGSPEAQVLATLDFVQKEVRYFGTELGQNTHRPVAPQQVLKQRFGDCKDKVGLLIGLLQQQDIQASPVLVSSFLREDLPNVLPSPLAFDHVISRVDLGGSTYWLDATHAHQTGALAERQSIGFGQGLVLAADSTQPVLLPRPYDKERLNVRDIIHFKSFTEDPTLEARITYRGDYAEGMREVLAKQNLSDVANQLGSPYLKLYPKARMLGTAEVEESSAEDAVTLVLHFVLPDFWRFPEQKALVSPLLPYLVHDALVLPRAQVREQPLAFPLLGIIRHTIVVEFPEDVYDKLPHARSEDGDAHLTLRQTLTGTLRSEEFLAELHVNVDQVMPEDWTAFSSKADEMLRKVSFVASLPTVPLARQPELLHDVKAELAKPRAKGAPDNSLDRARLLLLTAEIEGGRLTPPLAAQALTARATLNTSLGHRDAALADSARAQQLAPSSADPLNGSGLKNEADH